MKSKIKQLLLPFYFGAIDDSDRLTVEKELLIDSEVLVDYLDLKRQIESANSIPTLSNRVWYRLKNQVQSQKKFVLPVSLGAALIAGIALVSILYFRPKPIENVQPVHGEILFDSNSELPANSSVL